MSVRGKLFRGGAVIALGQVLGQGLAFTRNLIVARLVSPADYGIAATFAIAVLLLEMISNLNAGVLLVQSSDGDDPQLQGTAHAVSALRALAGAIVLWLLAKPIAYAFDVPQAAWAFRWLAVYPLLSGVTHLDTNRLQRQMRFGPAMLAELGSQVVATAAAWPLASWLHDYSALLWLLLLQRAAATAGSFVVAERHFEFAWDARFLRRILSFGWPLLVNGLLMFAIFQGDRTVIGVSPRLFARAHYSMSDVGVYSAAFTLAAAATTALTRISTSLTLPALSAHQGDPPTFARHYAMSVQFLCLIGGALGVGLLIAGRPLVVTLYGSRYAAAGDVIGWLGATQAVRIIRGGPTLAALAMGDSHNSMVANLGRLAGLAGVVATAAVGGSLATMAALGCAGEVVALVVSCLRLRKAFGVPVELCLGPAAVAGAGMAVAAVIALGVRQSGFVAAGGVAACGVAVLLAGGTAAMPAARRELRTSLAAAFAARKAAH